MVWRKLWCAGLAIVPFISHQAFAADRCKTAGSMFVMLATTSDCKRQYLTPTGVAMLVEAKKQIASNGGDRCIAAGKTIVVKEVARIGEKPFKDAVDDDNDDLVAAMSCDILEVILNNASRSSGNPITVGRR